MNSKKFLEGAWAFSMAKVLGVKIPLIVSWNLTFRCNQRCLYCRMWQQHCRELNSSEIFKMLDQFTRLGTKWIAFTGAEPLMREDIGEIVRYAKSRNVYVSLNTNGRLLPVRINELVGLDRIKLSLDGPKDKHDYIKGEGSFEKVVHAIDLCKRRNIPVYLEHVINNLNLDCINFLMSIAMRYKIKILFQPATKKLLHSEELNPFAPSGDRYKEVIKRLIDLKKQGAPVYNSLAGLQHLSRWPDSTKLRCFAGRLSIGVMPDGSISVCNRIHRFTERKYKSELNVKEELLKISYVRDCTECWCCSLVEFNLISSLNINALANFIKNN